MSRKIKQLSKNAVKFNLAFEDIKRCLDSNMEPADKVHKIEQILSSLYV